MASRKPQDAGDLPAPSSRAGPVVAAAQGGGDVSPGTLRDLQAVTGLHDGTLRVIQRRRAARTSSRCSRRNSSAQTRPQSRVYVFAVIAALRERLAAGEKADVLVMPVPLLDGYAKAGKVRAEARATFGIVGISVVVKQGARKPDISTQGEIPRGDAGRRVDRACHARQDAERHAYGQGDARNSASPRRWPARSSIARRSTAASTGRQRRGRDRHLSGKRSRDGQGLSVVGPLPPGIDLNIVYGGGGDRRQRRMGRAPS